MKKSVLIRKIVLALILIGIIVLVSCSFRGCEKEDAVTEIIMELDAVEELFVDVEQDYVDENGKIAIEEAPKLIDAVYEKVRASESVTYCEKSDLGVYMILDNGMGVHYNAPVEGVASSGNEIAIYSYQPFHDKFNEFIDFMKGGWYPDKGVERLLELDITTSGAQLRNENVTIESLKNMKGDSVIVWVGHGGYSTKTHSSLILRVPFNVDFIRDENNRADLNIHHRLEVSYCEGNYYVAVTSLFFDHYLEDGALDNSIIMLDACYSGKDDVLATSLMNKGATAVYAFSDSVLQVYGNKMCRTVLESLSEGYTVDESLDIAKDEHGEKDNFIWGLFSTECEMFVMYKRDVTLNDLFERKAGITDDSSKHRYTVTKEEWNSNMDLTNFTLTYNVGKDMSTGTDIMVTVKQTDNSVVYMLNNQLSVYYCIKNGVSYVVGQENGNWLGNPMTWAPQKWNTYLYIEKMQYDNFTFDEDRQAYVSTQFEGFEAVIKFENGKLISMESIDLNDPSNYTKVTFTNLGSTVVDVPNFTIQNN